jgi:hypothetical protein
MVNGKINGELGRMQKGAQSSLGQFENNIPDVSQVTEKNCRKPSPE